MPDHFPKAIRRESRVCFGISWFDSEEKALAYSRYVKHKDIRYNGGMFDGLACGRDHAFDKKDESGNIVEFAVTD